MFHRTWPIHYNPFVADLREPRPRFLWSGFNEEAMLTGCAAFKLFTPRASSAGTRRMAARPLGSPVYFLPRPADAPVLAPWRNVDLAGPSGWRARGAMEVGVEPEPEINATKPVVAKTPSRSPPYSIFSTHLDGLQENLLTCAVREGVERGARGVNLGRKAKAAGWTTRGPQGGSVSRHSSA